MILIWIPWIFVGMLCFSTKAFAIGRIWNFWIKLWTFDDKHLKSYDFDAGIFNKSLLAEFVLESLPQMIIQVFNNTLIGNWSFSGYFSTLVSLLIVANGLYRQLYWRLFIGIKFEDIPVSVDIKIGNVVLISAKIEKYMGKANNDDSIVSYEDSIPMGFSGKDLALEFKVVLYIYLLRISSKYYYEYSSFNLLKFIKKNKIDSVEGIDLLNNQ